MTRWLFWIGFEWIVICSALVMAYLYPVTFLLALLVLGSRQQALVILGHEAVHHAVAGKSILADRIADVMCFWVNGTSTDGFRAFHILHHAHVNGPLDPEVDERSKRPEQWTNLTPAKRRKLVLLDLIGFGIPEAVSISSRVRGVYTLPRVAFLAVLVILFLAAGLWPLLLLWVWSFLTVAWACARARMFREHWDMPVGGTHEYVATWWERALYLPHYIWKHAAHHRPGNWSTPAWDL